MIFCCFGLRSIKVKKTCRYDVFFAITTDTEKIKSVRQYFKTGFIGNFLENKKARFIANRAFESDETFILF